MSHKGTDADTATPAPLSSIERDWLDSLYAVWNEEGPVGLAQDIWHPRITWHDPPDAPDAGVYQGLEAVVEHLSNRLETIGRTTVTVDGAWWTDRGRTLVVDISLHSGGQSSGIELDVRVFHVLQMNDGCVVEVWEHFDRDQAFESAGLLG